MNYMNPVLINASPTRPRINKLIRGTYKCRPHQRVLTSPGRNILTREAYKLYESRPQCISVALLDPL